MIKDLIKDLRMKEKTKGRSIISKHIDKFQGIVDGLQKGIDECETEISTNNQDIDRLAVENSHIEKSKVQAASFKTNLANMMTVPDKKDEKVTK